MSLQVWLTGNNSMNNQGLLGELTQTTAPTYVDGKLGKAMSTGAYKMTAEQTAQVLNNEAISICFWVYINADTGSTDNRVPFFGNDYWDSNTNNRKFTLYNYPTVNDFHWSWMNNTAGNSFAAGVLSGVLPSYKWTHVAITYQNPNGTVYINGEKAGAFTGVSNSSTFAYETQVIHNSSYLRWNDYRIYNHCLSAKEVKEISKGLVCHYPLKSQYETGQVNKYSGDVAEGYLTGSFTRTKLKGERGYNYKLSYTGTGDYSWPNMKAGNFYFTAGKRYYYSCKVRCHSTNFGLYLRASRSDNDWATNMADVLNPDGEWHEYVVYQTINETYDMDGSTVTCNPTLEFFSDNLSTPGKVYSADFDIKDIQVIESDCYVPFIDNNMVSNVVSDCSGYENHGTKVGNIVWKNDSPRYSGSYYFSTNAYIDCGTGGKIKDEITVNIWCHMDTWNDNIEFVCCAENGGWEIYNKNSHPTFDVFISDIGYVFASSSKLWSDLSSGWHMITGSYDGFNAKLYIDGILESSVSSGKSSKTSIHYTSTNSIYIHAESRVPTPVTGYDACKLSDCRIYATALSEKDIKSLYNVSASICKTGVLSAYEFVEEG